MADIILTLKQIENIFQSLTCSLTGLNNDSGVRLSWPTKGSPGWSVNEDVVFQVVFGSDSYTQQRETEYQDDIANDVKKVIASYTRVHNIKWTIYGPNSYEHGESIKNGIYLPTTRGILRHNNLSLILNVGDVKRFPELFNGQWWERVDFEASFNEKVVRYSTIPYLVGVNIQVKKG